MAERHLSKGTFNYVEWLENRIDKLEQRLQALDIGYDEHFRYEVPEVMWEWLCANRPKSVLKALIVISHRQSPSTPLTITDLRRDLGTLCTPAIRKLLEEYLCRVNSRGEINLCLQLEPLCLLPYEEMEEDIEKTNRRGGDPLPFVPTYRE